MPLLNSTLSYRYDQPENYLGVSENNTLLVADFVQQTIADAIAQHASDIHFEPRRTDMRVRFRIDGILHDICHPPKNISAALCSHLKVCAELDIAEKRLPQDGRLLITLANRVRHDCRISSCPTLYGEKIVLRLLQTDNDLLTINQLGMSEIEQQILLHAIQKPQGLIIITGPTGCGKTTTLYAALNFLNSIQRNINTIEDPIEITLDGINQLNVNHKIGFDFKRALKAILRQDPDVIMVGEIRDLETANMAIYAAQTGHLVLTTLHTNSAIETLNRLSQMGISALNLTESLTLIIAQRLVRTRCQSCYSNKTSSCHLCQQGYHGRCGIFEMLNMTREIKSLLWQQLPPHQIIKKCKLTTLKQAGINCVKQGLTTDDEIKRVIG